MNNDCQSGQERHERPKIGTCNAPIYPILHYIGVLLKTDCRADCLLPLWGVLPFGQAAKPELRLSPQAQADAKPPQYGRLVPNAHVIKEARES